MTCVMSSDYRYLPCALSSLLWQCVGTGFQGQPGEVKPWQGQPGLFLRASGGLAEYGFRGNRTVEGGRDRRCSRWMGKRSKRSVLRHLDRRVSGASGKLGGRQAL